MGIPNPLVQFLFVGAISAVQDEPGMGLCSDPCPECNVLGQEGYKYSTSGLYYAPTAETIEDFVTYIKGWECQRVPCVHPVVILRLDCPHLSTAHVKPYSKLQKHVISMCLFPMIGCIPSPNFNGQLFVDIFC